MPMVNPGDSIKLLDEGEKNRYYQNGLDRNPKPHHPRAKKMIIRNTIGIVAAVLFLFSIPAHAEFYQYKDDNGVVHYTDNYSTIPAPYRSQVESHAETPPDATREAATAKPQASEKEKSAPPAWNQDSEEEKETQDNVVPEPTEASAEGGQKESKTEWLKEQRAGLLKRKEQLDRQHENLIKERQELQSKRDKMEEPAEIEAYNQKVQELNEKITQYQEKQSALKSEIESYNKRIKEQ